MSRNIEVKARLRDLAAAEETAQKLGAHGPTRLDQVDIFYASRRGRLKLRCVNDRWELIGYRRDDRPEARGSDYSLLPLSDADPLDTILRDALGRRGEVRKRRILYLHDNVRIHLDQVENLGTFLELEAIVDDQCDDETALAKINRLLRSFGISSDKIESGSYADLLGFGDSTEDGPVSSDSHRKD